MQRIGQVGGLEVDLRGGHFRNKRSPEYLVLHGLPPEAANESHEDWVARIHPADRARVLEHFVQTVGGTECDYEVEYRIVRPSDGAIRWIMAKAEIERDTTGAPLRLVGAHVDITARRQAEDQRDLISRELSHRIANIFTVLSSLIQMSARLEPESAVFAEKLIERIGSLHQAHLIVTASEEQQETTLVGLIDRMMAPYRNGDIRRISVTGDDAGVGKHAVTPLALMLHELATNAVKYGCLSTSAGRLTIVVKSRPDLIDICWRETGGPPVSTPPSRRGFGSTLVDRAARSLLGATVSFDWPPSGLTLTATIPMERLAR